MRSLTTLILTLILGLTVQAHGQTAFSVVSDRDITSPDGRAVLAIHSTPDDDLAIWLSSHGHRHVLRHVENIITVAALTGATWSPDSRRFAVTASDTGGVGAWHVFVYRLNGTKAPLFTDVDALLAPRLRHFSHCDGGPEINYYAAAWLHHGRQLAVIAQVANHSLCRDMGKEKAFVLDTHTWQVVRVVPEKSIPKSWRDY